jgi:tRNA nucleotidyltransferase (CCA-adding enzyme)
VELIISHMNADFDACASMVGARRLYPDAKLVFPGSQERRLRDFIEDFFPIDTLRVRDIALASVSRLIIVDTKSPERIGPLAELLSKPGIEIHIYDHHEHGPSDIHGSFETIERLGATTTLIAEAMKRQRLKPTPIEATLMMLGIYEETGNLLYPTTTGRDFAAAAWLLRSGATLNVVKRYLREELSREEIHVLNELAANVSDTAVAGMRVVIASASSDAYLPDAAHLAHRLLDMQSADAAVILIRMEGRVLVVGRSRTPQINIAKAIESIGGGGHPSAASATVEDEPLDLLSERIQSALASSVTPGKFAIDVMTSPVISIESGRSIGKAEEAMTRFEVNAMPVLREGAYAGIITREVVEKAIHHGLLKNHAMDFATTDAISVGRYTAVREIEKRMIEQNQRFVPVVEDGRVLGAITRTDLLRSMYDDYLRRTGITGTRPDETRAGPAKNLGSLLKDRLPEVYHRLLRAAGEIAEEMGISAYLVGGSVRDLLRGEENLDMDIVVEGDGIAFAHKLADTIGARVHPHERFGTAKLVINSHKIDIATARTEFYESPAALPQVTLSSIKKDLYRRDFTINTLAVKLDPAQFGALVDFFGGQRDIKERTVRVLHNLSFVEDPTRAFRAVRFAERFGFRISKHTRDLITSAVRMKLFDKLTGSRIVDELSLIFDEKEPVKVLKELDSLGLLGVLHPKIRLTPETEARLKAVHETLSWFSLLFTSETPDRTAIYLAALESGLDAEDRRSAAERLMLSSKTASHIEQSLEQSSQALRTLPSRDPAELYDTLAHLRLEAVLLTMAYAEHEETKKEISSYLVELRKLRPALAGKDLKAMGIKPGPEYSHILKTLLYKRLKGEITSKEDEERLARKLATKNNEEKK